jgi:hypothetical protein
VGRRETLNQDQDSLNSTSLVRVPPSQFFFCLLVLPSFSCSPDCAINRPTTSVSVRFAVLLAAF